MQLSSGVTEAVDNGDARVNFKEEQEAEQTCRQGQEVDLTGTQFPVSCVPCVFIDI